MPEFTKTIDVEFEFEAFCAKCGGGMCGNITVEEHWKLKLPRINITPCETCLQNERDEGENEGYEMAMDEREG